MKYENVVPHLVHWRIWWSLASFAFAACFLAIVFGDLAPRISPTFVRVGIPTSIVLFFVGFACLAWRQRNGVE